MPQDKLEFETRTAKITIDYSRCEPAIRNISNPQCGFACVKACRLYGRNILKIEGNKPVLLTSDLEEIKRLDNECLGCEYIDCLLTPNCHCEQSPTPTKSEILWGPRVPSRILNSAGWKEAWQSLGLLRGVAPRNDK